MKPQLWVEQVGKRSWQKAPTPLKNFLPVCLTRVFIRNFFSLTVNFPVWTFTVTPHARCRLRLLKAERIKDYLLLEQEFIRNMERLKPFEEKHEVSQW